MKTHQFHVEMKAIGDKAEVLIYDSIGDSFKENPITAKAIRKQLDDLGDVKEIALRINSQGGSVFHSLAIYNALKEHPAAVTVHVDGLAASAASLLAMVGDEILIAENGMLMIHNPVGVAYGDAKAMRKAAEMLDKIRASVISVYSSRTGQDVDTVGAWMDAETWMDSTEAVTNGFADSITKNKQAKPVAKPASQQPGLKLVAMFAGVDQFGAYESLIADTIQNCKDCSCTTQRGISMSVLEADYRAEYEEQKHIHNQLGVSVEDYIETRMIEDGHIPDPVLTLYEETEKPSNVKNSLPGLVDWDSPDWN